MTLQHINITDLTVSPLNVRKFAAKDCTDLVISIRALGVLQPLLVRPAKDGFEVVAGQRRLNACRIIAEDADIDSIPCLVMAKGDDAKAIEASLAENIERLPMDEVDQYKAFTVLIKQGRTTDDIAATFGITERLVNQRLALGRLHAPILTAYRKDELHAHDMRTLTMASMKQQKAWWALVKDDDAYAPKGQRLKEWLFGGANIPTDNASFDVAASGLAVVSDLFGDEAYFADADNFWALQNTAIAEAVEQFKTDGWADVIVLEIGSYFSTWEHCETAKADGGKVFITCSHQGEVTFHKGYISRADAKRNEASERSDAPVIKPELTKAAQNYVDLHRHAAVRGDLLDHSAIALRLMVAHMIAGSSLWNVQADPQTTAKPETAESLEGNTGQLRMATERIEIATLLRLEPRESVLENRSSYASTPFITEVFATLQALLDADVTRIQTFLMAESLSMNSPLLDTLAQTMETNMADHWTPDITFFELIRSKQVLNAMVGELAGTTVAKANIAETGKTQRTILCECINGSRAPIVSNWTPPYMGFPSQSYREKAVADELVSAELHQAA
jgi:ParB family chromosome partitioning protein